MKLLCLFVLLCPSLVFGRGALPELALKEGSLRAYGRGCNVTPALKVKVGNSPSNKGEHTKLKLAFRDQNTKPILSINYNKLPEDERTNLVVKNCFISFVLVNTNAEKNNFTLSFSEKMTDYFYTIEEVAEPLYRSVYGFSVYFVGQRKFRGFADLKITQSDDGKPRRGKVSVKLDRNINTRCQNEFQVVLKFALIQRALRYLPPEDDPNKPRPNAKLEISRLGDLQGLARTDTCT